MPRELEPDYESEVLFPPRLEDWVGPRHVARFVREFVEMLDLPALGFRVRDKRTGRKGISSKTLLSAWLYAYMTKQRSTRALERACRSDVGAIWLTGNLQPDHATLWAFFNAHRPGFKKLLKESALLACRMGLVDLNFVAIDGTKLRASTSQTGALCARDYEIAVAALDAEAERYLAEVTAAGDGTSAQLPEGMEDRKVLREAMARDLAELRSLGASRLSPVDPEARVMKTKEGLRFAYNAQAAVDAKSGIVVACEVSQEAHDSSLLSPMMDLVEDSVGARPGLTAADSGYFSGAGIGAAHEKGRDISISMRNRAPKDNEPLHGWLFEHDHERDLLVCPIGGELPFQGTATVHSGKDPVRRYRCHNGFCCPFVSVCTQDEKGRMVEVGLHREATLTQWEIQKARGTTRETMRKRAATVERVFGHVKRNLELRQVEHRGLDKVQAVWSTAMCATNLRTMMKVWAKG